MTTPQAEALRNAAQAALDAIRDIAIDAATEIADDYHMKMARYRPLRHAALDRDVRTLRDVAESLSCALAAVPEPSAEPAWKAQKAALDALDDGSLPGGLLSDMTGREHWPPFKAWANDYLGQGYSLAVMEGDVLDPITWHTFHGFCAGRATPPTPKPSAKHVGEVVLFGSIKEVSWRKGRLPAVGTKLYAALPTLPHGWVAVPVEPTPEMIRHGGGVCAYPPGQEHLDDDARRTWAAMLAAAPSLAADQPKEAG